MKHETLALWLGAAVLIGLRGWNLGGPSLWLDEAYSANYAGIPLHELVPRLAREATPPLYYVLLGLWTRVLGSGEWAVRALSALCSLAGVSVLGALVARIGGRRAGLLAFALAGCAPLQIYYAQEARMYALLGLLCIAQLWFAIRLLERPKRRDFAAAAALTWAALLTHNVSLWWVAGVSVGFLAVAPSNALRLRWLACQAAAGLAYLPWFWVLLQQLSKQAEVLAWFEPVWRARSLAGHLAASLECFSLGPFPPYLAIGSLPGARWLSLLCVLGAAAGALRLRHLPAVRLMSVALAVALLLSLGYSVGFQPVHIAGRTDQALLLPFLGLLALGVGGLRAPLGTYAAGGFALWALATLLPYYGSTAKDASQGWISAINREARPGDRLITTGLTRAEADYYLGQRNAIPLEIASFPARAAEHPGYLNYEVLRLAPEGLASDAQKLADAIRPVLTRGGQVFVTLTPPEDVNGVLIETLEATFDQRPRSLGDFQRAGGGPVRLLRFSPR